MLCKYCKKNTHLIDDCPEIICKKCRIVGHPFWKCKNGTRKNDSGGFKKVKGTKVAIGRSLNPPKPMTSDPELESTRKNIFQEFNKVLKDTVQTSNPDTTKENVQQTISHPELEETTKPNISELMSDDNNVEYYLKYRGIKWSKLIQ